MNSEFDWLLGLTFKMTFASAVLWGVHFSTGAANPRWRVWLWRIGSIGLTAILLSAFCEPLVEFRLPAVVSEVASVSIAQPSEPNNAVSAFDEMAAPSPAKTPERTPENVVSKTRTNPASTPFATHGNSVEWSPQLFAFVGWLVVVLLMIARRALSQWRLAGIVARAERAPEWVQNVSDGIAVQLGIRPIDIVSTADFRAPSVTGLRQPKILLPHGMLDRNRLDDLNAALTHELVHVHGGDLAWDEWIRVVTIILWPNPMCWSMPKAHRNACERLCDGVSAQRVGGEAYQSSLARIALELSEVRQATGLAMASTPDVIHRLRFLRKSVSTTSLGLGRLVATCVFAIAFGLLGICGLDVSPTVVIARPLDPTPQGSPTATKPEEVAEEVAEEVKPKIDVATSSEAVAVKGIETESPQTKAEQPKPNPELKLERQAVVTMNGKTLYAMLPSQPDYKTTREIRGQRVWQLANGKELRGQLAKVGRIYVTIGIGGKEVDVKKTDLVDAGQRLIEDVERLRKEQADWEKLRQVKAREAVLAERLPEFRQQFESGKQPKIVPCKWSVKNEPFGYVDGSILLECDFEFEKLAKGNYTFDVHVTSKRNRERWVQPSINWREISISFEIGGDLKLVPESGKARGAFAFSSSEVQRAELRGNTVHFETEIPVREAPYSCHVMLDERNFTGRNRLNQNADLPLPMPINAKARTFEQFLGEQ